VIAKIICMQLIVYIKKVHQNSYNLTSDNLEILIKQHLRRIVPRIEILLFTRKIFISETGNITNC